MTKIFEYTSLEERVKTMKTQTQIRKQAIEARVVRLPPPYNKPTGEMERDILKKLKEVCGQHMDWYVRIDVSGKIVRTHEGATFASSGMKGMPDVIALRQGRFFGLECKAPGGSISLHQISVLDEITKAGGIGCIVCSPEKLLIDDYFMWRDLRVY